ncbi:MAG: class I adenylate-forming enzyme family protein [Bacillota bacterium]
MAMHSSMYHDLHRAAQRYPDNVALNYHGTRISFTQLLQHIDRMAASFANLGLAAGDRVCLCLPNIPQTVIAFYALNRLGAVPCMVHPLSTAVELEAYLTETESKVLITLDFLYPKFEGVVNTLSIDRTIVTHANEQLPLLLSVLYYLKQGYKSPSLVGKKRVTFWREMQRARTAGTQQEPYVFGPNRVALILFSGGTTGKAKGVSLSNESMHALAQEIIAQVDPKPGVDSMLCILPLFHGFGLGISLHPVLIAGGCCILVPRFSPKEFASTIIRNRPAYIAGVPTLFEGFLSNKKIQQADLSFLKGAFCGGDVTHPDLIKRFNQFVRSRGSSTTLREGYGLTECVTACSIMPEGVYKEGSVGLPFASISIKVVDPDTLADRPAGEIGEICISGPTVMLGYYRREKESMQALRPHKDGAVWLHTGDLGYMDQEGYLYFVQRLKRIIKVSGYTVYPSQVEAVLNTHPLVQESCVVGVPCPIKMQKPKAFVVLKSSVADPTSSVAQIMDFLQERLIKWSVPAEIVICDALPRTAVGKVAHTVLERQGDN